MSHIDVFTSMPMLQSSHDAYHASSGLPSKSGRLMESCRAMEVLAIDVRRLLQTSKDAVMTALPFKVLHHFFLQGLAIKLLIEHAFKAIPVVRMYNQHTCWDHQARG